MKIAITGAGGHIGAALCRHLLEKGHELRVLVNRDDRGLRGLPLETVRGSVTDPATLDRLFKNAEIVQHLAAKISIWGDPDGSVERTNVGGTAQVVEACLRAGARRLVFFSSIHAYLAPPPDVVFDENRPMADAGFAYERSKAAAQKLVIRAVRERGLDAIVLNPSSVLGPFDFAPSLQGKMLLDFRNGKIPLLPPGGFDWVDNRDIVQAAEAAMHKGSPGESYLLSGHFCTVRALAGEIGRIVGKKTPSKTLPFWFLNACVPAIETWARISGQAPLFTRESLWHLRSGHPNVSHQKAASAFGYAPRPLQDTLRDSLDWLINNL